MNLSCFFKLVGSMCAISGVLVMSLPIPIIAGNFEKFHKTQAKKNKLLKRRAALVAAKENEEKVRFKLNYPWGKTIFMICSGENCGHLRPRLTSLPPAPGQESSAESPDHEDLGLPEKLQTLRQHRGHPHPAMRLSSVTRSANQRPVLAPLTNETPTPCDILHSVIYISKSKLLCKVCSKYKLSINERITNHKIKSC